MYRDDYQWRSVHAHLYTVHNLLYIIIIIIHIYIYIYIYIDISVVNSMHNAIVYCLCYILTDYDL